MYFTQVLQGLLALLVICMLPDPSWAGSFSANSSYTVCFTPGQNCEAKIIDQINRAQRSVLIQAYSFTSVPILSALVAAKDRGVKIRVILDKSQYHKDRYSSATFLDNHGIAVWVDTQPAIAHNKVMIIDNQVVMTGSFNFTKAAQHRNQGCPIKILASVWRPGLNRPTQPSFASLLY